MEGPARSSRAQRVLDAVQRSRAAEDAFRAGYDGPGDAVEVLRRWLAAPDADADRGLDVDVDVAEQERAGLLHAFDALADEAAHRAPPAHPTQPARTGGWTVSLPSVRDPRPRPDPLAPAAPRPSSGPRHSRRRTAVIAATIGAASSVAIIAVVLSVIAQGSGDAHPIASGVTPTPGWTQLDIPSPWGPASGPEAWFADEQSDADLLADPSILTVSGSRVDQNSLRLVVADAAGWDFRLGLTPDDDVCLIATAAVQPSAVAPASSGIHCVPPAEATDGIVLSYLPTDSGAVSARWDGTTLRLRRTGGTG
ncbi:hypothetical protein ACFJGV_09125 [Cnuibacter sp. UC19_7]|uniref:hypothetical protein n=1 Tax=Cnuibacter sp. UC19_7 TaxID=3350166 RepID=UPI00366C5E45